MKTVLFHIPSNQGTFLLLLKHIFYPHNCWIDTRKPIKVLIHNHFLLIFPSHSPSHFHDEPTRDKRKIHNVTRKLEKKENPSLYLQIFSQQIDLLSHSLSLECIRGIGPFLLRFNGSPGLEMFNWLFWYYWNCAMHNPFLSAEDSSEDSKLPGRGYMGLDGIQENSGLDIHQFLKLWKMPSSVDSNGGYKSHLRISWWNSFCAENL